MDLDMEMLEEESDGEEYDEQDDEVGVSYQVLVPRCDVMMTAIMVPRHFQSPLSPLSFAVPISGNDQFHLVAFHLRLGRHR